MAFHRRHRPGVTAWSPHPRPRRPSRRRTPRPPRRRPSSCHCLHRHPTPFSLSHSTRQQDGCNRRSRRSAGAGRDRRQKVWTRTGPSRSWNEPTGMSSPCGSRSWFPAHREQTVGPRCVCCFECRQSRCFLVQSGRRYKLDNHGHYKVLNQLRWEERTH